MTNLNARFEVEGATVSVDVDDAGALVFAVDGGRFEPTDTDGLYRLVTDADETERRRQEHAAKCRALARSFVDAATCLLGGFEQAEQDGYVIAGGADWPAWLPSFDEAALGLAGLAGPDGFEVQTPTSDVARARRLV